MTRDDIIRMARDAGFSLKYFGEPPKPYIHVFGYGESLERFAKLVYEEAWADTALAATHTITDAAIALEREACAKVCGELADNPENSEQYRMGANWARERIRARSNP